MYKSKKLSLQTTDVYKTYFLVFQKKKDFFLNVV